MTASRKGLMASLRVRRGDFELALDLHVEPGETVALVGPNGAGKSTTIELLAGLQSLSADSDGSIVLGDDVLDDPAAGVFVPPERRRVGVVFQQHLLFEHLSARANVAFGLRAGGIDRRSAGQQADGWLERFGVGDLADQRPSQLSGGQSQRVAIARTLAVDPRLLLLDEPLAALDVETRVDVRRRLRDHLTHAGHPTVLISHDPSDALLLSDRIAVIEAGSITQLGTPDEIRRRPATRYAAALAGTNLIDGRAAGGVVTVTSTAQTHEPDQPHRLQVADAAISGPVICSVRPAAISLHTERPAGSQRNVWPTTVDLLEPMGDTTRVTVGAPLALAVDVTNVAVNALRLTPGSDVWVAVKATEITVSPA